MTSSPLHPGSALLTSIAVGVLGFCMSTEWAKMAMECTRNGSSFSNGSAVVTLGPFTGHMNRSFCPLFGGQDEFTMLQRLADLGVGPVALHSVVLCLLVLCLVFSGGSILISLYNSVSNPYETYMGPIGLYVCSSLSAFFSVLVLLIFALNVTLTSMAEDLVQSFADTLVAELRNKTSEMQLGYYLVVLYPGLSLFVVALVYFYDHTAYTQRREQQRPTEDAPKEIMMY
uniref:Clarin 3 n=1 Tax=Gasterosteus aculeatus aculeatus TaxID=481459 RepID=G3NDS9_GASAC